MMKRYQVIITNLLIIVGIIVFILLYAEKQRENIASTQVASFESMTVAMCQVTTNYLEQEQRLADNWGAYINNNHLTLQEATDAVSDSQAHKDDVMAHLVYFDDNSQVGLSTHPRSDDPTCYDVSYKEIDLMSLFSSDDLSSLQQPGVHVTRAYANPTDGSESIAFCSRIVVYDNHVTRRDALLLRVVPTSLLATKWVFPIEEYRKAEISLIDGNGNYMIKGDSFKGSSFYEFYESSNTPNSQSMAALQKELTSTTGTFTMKTPAGAKYVVAHSPVNSTEDWTIVSLIEVGALPTATIDWPLIVITAIALLALLLFDMLVMVALNRRERQAALAAENASRAKSEFLSNMSHEIRTPITAILGMNELIQRESEKETVLSYSDNIKQASNSLLGIISDILDYTKIESGRMELEESEYDLVSFVDTLVNLTRIQAVSKGLDFVVSVDPTLPSRLCGDVTHLKQVVLNLLSNAIKYTEQGYVRLELTLVTRGQDTVRMRMSVIDTGLGIKKEEMGKLFSEFDRLDPVHTRHIEGTGLGLVISKKLLNLQGSDLLVESEYGKGSTFFFEIDQTVVNQAEVGEYRSLAESSTQQRSERLSKKVTPFEAPSARILAVDDTPINLQVICGLLERTKAQIDTANSGAECIEKLASNDYDLVLLDYRMPVMDGIETLTQIGERYPQKAANTPIVCVTACSLKGDRERMLEAGFTDYLSKPVDVDALDHMLLTHLPAQKVIRPNRQTELLPPEPQPTGLQISRREFEEACITLRGRVNNRDLDGLQLLFGILDTYEMPMESREWLDCLQETVGSEDWDAVLSLFETKGV